MKESERSMLLLLFALNCLVSRSRRSVVDGGKKAGGEKRGKERPSTTRKEGGEKVLWCWGVALGGKDSDGERAVVDFGWWWQGN